MTTHPLVISTEPTLLDVSFIHGFLSTSYWAKGRSIEDMKTIIRHSLNFGAYLDGQQIGYARVVTDFVQFAYLLDVFITPDQQGRGYARQLMAHLLGAPELKRVKVWRLATTDAHSLYAPFGFQPLSKPETMMELIRS
jgi:GNAT superfamily N-acetyltransferase